MLTEGARFQVESSADGSCIMVSGEVDMLSKAEVALAVDAARATHEEVVLDLSAVTFMDSSGLQVLCVAHAESPIRLRGLPEHVQQLLALTGLDDVFQIESE